MTEISEEVLRDRKLAGYAYAALPPEHPARAALRADYLTALADHHATKRELLPLIEAWNRAGVEPLLFKGFHLSEFVYPAPGMRFHGDVDTLVPAERGDECVAIARSLGWTVEHESAAQGRPHAHYICALRSPRNTAYVDLHRWVLHSVHRWNGVQRRVTRAVWRASRPRTWDGVRIREMTGADALIVGLALNRAWSGDRWHFKAHDGIDAALIVEYYGVTQEDLRARARELGVERSVELHLARCDPFERRIDTRRPTPVDIRRWDRSVFRERGLLGRAERWLALASESHQIVADMLRGLRSFIAAYIALGRFTNMDDLLRVLTPAGPPTRERPASLARTLRGARVWTRLLARNPAGDCLLKSLAGYHVLRKHGWPVRFVSGIRRDGDDIVGHAWLELDGRVLPELGEAQNRQLYAVTFEYPR